MEVKVDAKNYEDISVSGTENTVSDVEKNISNSKTVKSVWCL